MAPDNHTLAEKYDQLRVFHEDAQKEARWCMDWYLEVKHSPDSTEKDIKRMERVAYLAVARATSFLREIYSLPPLGASDAR